MGLAEARRTLGVRGGGYGVDRCVHVPERLDELRRWLLAMPGATARRQSAGNRRHSPAFTGEQLARVQCRAVGVA